MSPLFFSLLGAEPQLGQVFTAASVKSGGDQDLVLSDALWRDLFGGRESILGTRAILGGKSYRIVGVMPRVFSGIESETVELWIPWAGPPERPVVAGEICCIVVARLSQAISPALVSDRLSRDMKSKRLVPIALREHLLGPRLHVARLLGLAIGLVLVLAVVAMVHGQVAHTLAGGPDLAVLHACGASRRQVWATIVVEEVLLALAALPFMVGVACLMWWVIQPLVATTAVPSIPVQDVVRWILACGLGVSIGTGSATATILSRGLDISALVTRQNISASPFGRKWRKGLSFGVATVVVVMLMLTHAVVRGVQHANRFSLGIDGRDIVVVGLRLNYDSYRNGDAVDKFESRALAALSDIPGVMSATFGSGVPILSPGRVRVVSDGVSGRLRFNEYRVHPRYFEMLAIPLVEGRRFSDNEAEPVAIVSRECTAQIGAGSPLGTALSLTGPTRIIGVVGDVTSDVTIRSRCAVYVPSYQETTWESRILLKVPTYQPSFDRKIRHAVAAIDPTQPVARIALLDEVLAHATAAQESVAVVVGSLAVVGWLIAVVWFNGVMTKITFDKRPEIGVRLAIGGSPLSVAWLVTWLEVWPLALGALVGIVAAGPLVRFAQHLVFAPDLSSTTAGIVFAFVGLGAMVAACFAPVLALTRQAPTDLLKN